jgi:Domain of Unknown Function (DUF1206)
VTTSSRGRHAVDQVAQAADSDWLTRVARVGLAGFGVVHLLLAWLALQIAWGGGGREADQTGALQTLAAQPFGELLLWALGVGLFALALWQASLAIWGYRRHQGGKRTQRRVVSASRTVVYLALAAAAVRLAVGTGTSAAAEQEQATADALGLPGGRLIVGAAGLAVLAVGVGLLWRAFTEGFRENLDLAAMGKTARTWGLRLGRAGYAAKGVVFGIVGLLVIAAAVTYDPDKSRGLDTALKTLAGQPFGQWLLSAIAVGIACYGAYCFLWARYPRD